MILGSAGIQAWEECCVWVRRRKGSGWGLLLFFQYTSCWLALIPLISCHFSVVAQDPTSICNPQQGHMKQ